MTGIFTGKVDESMRMSLPVAFFTKMGGEYHKGQTVYLAIYEQVITVYDKKVWKELQVHDNSTGEQYPELTQYSKCTIDRSGSITLPRWLANKVSIYENNDVCCVGAGETCEIYNSLIWDRIELQDTYTAERRSYEPIPLSLYLSYSPNDWRIIEEINTLLLNFGYITILDRKDIIEGEHMYDKIQKTIDDADYFLFFATESAASSEWCSRELSRALEIEAEREEQFIIPLKLDDVTMPDIICHKEYIDIHKDKPSGLRELSDTLLKLEGYDYSPPEEGFSDIFPGLDFE